ncbi:MAG: hypothetical protein JWO47_670 [Candidatus Saccharibacteria bacterium]|nr:hypothetical protein [Candidatus Saccharibacteria bacterium]
MSNLEIEAAREAALEARQVLFPNRYEEPLIEAFQDLTGIEVPTPKPRQITVMSKGVTFVFPRGRNIPWLTALANRQQNAPPTIGMTGSEWYGEYAMGSLGNYNRPRVNGFQIRDKKMGEVALFTPSNVDSEETALQFAYNKKISVVTPYPKLLAAIAVSDGWRIYQAEIFDDMQETISGGVEAVAEMFGLPGVDLVCKGDTLDANNCTYIGVLRDVFPTLVAAGRSRSNREAI